MVCSVNSPLCITCFWKFVTLGTWWRQFSAARTSEELAFWHLLLPEIQVWLLRMTPKHTPSPEVLLQTLISKCNSGILCMDLPRISQYALGLFKAQQVQLLDKSTGDIQRQLSVLNPRSKSYYGLSLLMGSDCSKSSHSFFLLPKTSWLCFPHEFLFSFPCLIFTASASVLS